MRNIIFIAPPAAGKGTVSDYLVKNYGYKHLSTGDLLREEISKGSEFGREIDRIISNGNLVSDDIMIKLVCEKLNGLRNSPFILDGFPRTFLQAQSLDEMLMNIGVNNNVVIYLNISYDLALKRALGRVVCPKCKRSYNTLLDDAKPLEENICDDCHTLLTSRSDDNEESFKIRFENYLENASSLIDYYRKKGLLKEIKVDNDLDKLLKQVVKEAKND